MYDKLWKILKQFLRKKQEGQFAEFVTLSEIEFERTTYQ